MNHLRLSSFNYQVSWRDAHFGFSEISGLNNKLDVRRLLQETDLDSNQSNFQSLTLRRGLYIGNINYEQWIHTTKNNNDEINEISIQTFHQELLYTWKVSNPKLITIRTPYLMGNFKVFSIEIMEIAHEGILLI